MATLSRRCIAYSKEGDGDNDAPVLGAGELVDGVADVAGVRLGGAATANACRCLSFGRHVVMCVVVICCGGDADDDVS
jgi:hypothetical protein